MIQEYPVIENRATVSHMGLWLESLPSILNLRQTVERVEKALICRALKAAGGVQAKAARNLGISRSDMAYKLKKYELSV